MITCLKKEISAIQSLKTKTIGLFRFANLSEKEKIEIKSLKRGECLMFVGEDHILTKIECSELEKKILEGDKNEQKSYNSN